MLCVPYECNSNEENKLKQSLPELTLSLSLALKVVRKNECNIVICILDLCDCFLWLIDMFNIDLNTQVIFSINYIKNSTFTNIKAIACSDSK